MTKEHVLRNSMGKVLDLGMTNTQHSGWNVADDGIEVETTDYSIPVGPYDWEIRGFCAPCNNGWMNDLDIAAEDTLVRLINGSNGRITVDESTAISNWAAKTAAVRALFDKGQNHVVRADLDWMHTTHSIPQHWQVWIGRSSLAPERRVFTRHFRMALAQAGHYERVHVTVLAQNRLAVIVRGTEGLSYPMDSSVFQSWSISSIDETERRIVEIFRHGPHSADMTGRGKLTRKDLIAVSSRIGAPS
ncbi:hypothetical protein HQO90_16660 [Rhodococcus fascians]|nr:hypothetical protein [Rhodococcus fascians]MBY4056963.1 hypothetical protein [Rhodococcus fascians]MBY4068346.1 hypothetical protein [Rhodococcus fascians]